MNGCSAASGVGSIAMEQDASRDRVTIDLRGIGDAVRAAAATRNVTLAHFARQTLMAALPAGSEPPRQESEFTSYLGQRSVTKLTLRMSRDDAELLIAKAATLDLPYGQFVAHLVNGRPLPMPAADRRAEILALRTSNDHLSVIASDISLLLRSLTRRDSGSFNWLHHRLTSLDTDIAQHLQRAAAVISRSA